MKSYQTNKDQHNPYHRPVMVRVKPFLQYGLFLVIGMLSFNVYAANYSLPADIGTGIFKDCSGAGPSYTCTKKVTLAGADTVVLTSDVTLNINGEFKVSPGASATNGGFVFNVFATKIRIDGSGVVEINLTASGEIKIQKMSNVTGNINSTGGDVLIEGDGNTIVGDVTAAGVLVIEGTSTVDGTCIPTHPKCSIGGGPGPGPGPICTTTQIDPGGEEFKAISGNSDSNVIAVGINGSIYHYDGTTWVKNVFSAGTELRDVEVIASGEAWAVGKNGKVVQYDGTVWTTLPAPTGEDLRGVWAISSTEVWVVGKKNSLYLWNGVSWSNMSAAAGVDNNQELRAAWGFSTYFYAVEKDGDLYRYTRTGGPWAAKITTCNDLYDMDIERMWGDGTGNVYLAGKNKAPNPDEATVFLYDQNTNSCSIAYTTTTIDKFNGVAGDGSIVFAAGKAGTIVDNATGNWVESTEGTQEIKDVWVSSSKTAYFAAKGGFVTICNDAATASLDHFSITPTTTSASTCLANAITIVARTVSNYPIFNYTNLVSISVSTSHGNWSINNADGTLSPNPDTDDNGAVSYTFFDSDDGEIVLDLSNTHAESLTITVNDAVESVTSNSELITFNENTFIITEDPIQIAGRPQAMTIAMWTDDTASSGSCGIDPNYNSGAQSLEVSVDRSGVLPTAIDPTINGVAVLDTSAFGSITLNFSTGTVGQASFNLGTTDVGKYRLIIRDTTLVHSDVVITGASAELTVKPFGLAVTNIQAGATPNPVPPGTTPGGALFTNAGSNFSATVVAVLWEAADDQVGNDGVLDTGNYLNNTVAPSYAWDTTLSVAVAGFEPSSGIAGILNNGLLSQGSFVGGMSSPANLQYTEVGSFTLQSLATDYLGVGTADIVGDSIVIGRFRPASFLIPTVIDGAFADTCSVYSYIGESFGYDVNPSFELHALNALGDITTNYTGAWEKIDNTSVDFTAPTSDQTKLGTTAVLMPLTYTQNAALFNIMDYGDGTFDIAFANDQYVFDRDSNSEVTPFASDIDLLINDVTDTEGVTTTIGTTLTPAPANLRFGRLRMSNAHGSELFDLAMPMVVEYLLDSGVYTVYTTNGLDNCTTISDLDLVTVQSPLGLSVVTVTSPTAVGGVLGVTLAAPVSGNSGDVVVTPDLAASVDTWLQYDWTGAGVFDEDPTAQATFGIYKGNDVNIYKSQTYQQ